MKSHTYMPCPNGCDGEVVMGVEYLDGPDPTVGIFGATYGTWIEDADGCHAPGCPPLTHAQREALVEQADDKVNAPDYWGDDEP